MILSFKQQFVEKILDNSKIHTIREDKPNRWKAGNKIHMATGVRTKNYKQFAEKECISTQEIEIIHGEKMLDTKIIIDGEILNMNEKIKLANNDGFDSFYGHFLLWFHQDFKGKIIHWTNFKY